MSTVQYERNGEIVESDSTYEVQTPNASYAVIKATIDSQIATARAFRRSITVAINEIKTYAGLTKEIATSCMYSLKRGQNTIDGPSARFAEILASSWGNIRVQGRVIEETDRYIVVAGECIDLERNSGRSVEVRRNITDRYGNKYSADMVAVTANAAISIATRNAIFQVIPRAFWQAAFDEVKTVIKGKLAPIEEERTKWLGTWSAMGVTEARVFEALGVRGRPEITDNHILTMMGWENAIKDRETTVHDIFPIMATSTPSPKAQDLSEKLNAAKAKTTAPKPAPAKEQDLPWEPGSNG